MTDLDFPSHCYFCWPAAAGRGGKPALPVLGAQTALRHLVPTHGGFWDCDQDTSDVKSTQRQGLGGQ